MNPEKTNYTHLKELAGWSLYSNGRHFQIAEEKVCNIGGSCVDIVTKETLADGKSVGTHSHMSRDNEVLRMDGSSWYPGRLIMPVRITPDIDETVKMIDEIIAEKRKKWYTDEGFTVNLGLAVIGVKRFLNNKFNINL